MEKTYELEQTSLIEKLCSEEVKANDLKKILTRVKVELELSVKAMTEAELVLAAKQSSCDANRAIIQSELDGLRCEAEGRNAC